MTPSRLRTAAAGPTGLFVGMSVVNLSMYVFHAVVSRLLGRDAYGAAGSLLAISAAVNVATAAIQTAVTRRVVRDGRVLNPWRLEAIAAGGAAGVCALGLLGRHPLSAYLHLHDPNAAFVVTCVIGAAAAGMVARGVLLGSEQFATVSLALIVGAALRTVLGIVVAAAGAGAVAVVAAVAAGEAVTTLVAVAGMRHHGWDREGQLAINRFEVGLPVGAYIGFWFLTSVDTILVRHYLAPSDSGLYVAASTLAGTTLFLSVAVVGAAFPGIAAAAVAGSAMQQAARAMTAVAVLTGAAIVVIEAFPELLLRLTFGGRFAAAAPILRILALSYGVLAVTYVGQHVLVAVHRRLAMLPGLWVIAVAAGIAARHSSTTTVAAVTLTATASLTIVVTMLALRQHGPAPAQSTSS